MFDPIDIALMKKLGGGSGSGGGLPTGGAPYQQLVTDGTGKATWEDRLAYVEQSFEKITYDDYEETTFNNSNGTYEGQCPVNLSSSECPDGTKLKVSLDGTEYITNVSVIKESGYTLHMAGNLHSIIQDAPDTGEPFYIVMMLADEVPEPGHSICQLITTLSGDKHTIKIFLAGEIVHPVDEKYVEPEVFWITQDYEKGTIDKTLDEVNDAYDAGKVLIVKSGQDVWFCIGRIIKRDGPIFISYSYTRNQFGVYVNTPFSEYPSSGLVELQHKITDSVILNSSTSGSTKKFKITVDDSGTISATEVTS